MDGTEHDIDSGISDAELFAGAAESGGTQDIGNDAGQSPPPPVAEQQTAPPPANAEAAPGQQDQGHRIPLAEHLAERERRQQFERELAEERRQREGLQRQIEALRNPQRPVDLLTDPQRFQETIDQRLERQQNLFEQRFRVHSINTSFSFADRQHGEEFRKAFAALEEAAAPHRGGDLMLRDRIVNSPDPGEAVMQWYRSMQVLQESGGDLSAFKDRLLKEQRDTLLKDPQFLAEAMKAARAAGAANPTIRPSTPTGLPSLTRTTSAAPNQGDDDGDMSDGELLRYALGRRK